MGVKDVNFIVSLRRFYSVNHSKEEEWFLSLSTHSRDVRHAIIAGMEGYNVNCLMDSAIETNAQAWCRTKVIPFVNMKADAAEIRESEAVAYQFLDNLYGRTVFQFLKHKIIDQHATYLSEDSPCICTPIDKDVTTCEGFLASLMLDLVGSTRQHRKQFARPVVPFHRKCLSTLLTSFAQHFIKTQLKKMMMFANGVINSPTRKINVTERVIMSVRHPDFNYVTLEGVTEFNRFVTHSHKLSGVDWSVSLENDNIQLRSGERMEKLTTVQELTSLYSLLKLPNRYVNFDFPKAEIKLSIERLIKRFVMDEKQKMQEQAKIEKVKTIKAIMREVDMKFTTSFVASLDLAKATTIAEFFRTENSNGNLLALWNISVVHQGIGKFRVAMGPQPVLYRNALIYAFGCDIAGKYCPGKVVAVCTPKVIYVYRPGFPNYSTIQNDRDVTVTGSRYTVIDGGGLIVCNGTMEANDIITSTQLEQKHGTIYGYMSFIMMDIHSMLSDF